jgi:hypothetical protein
MENALPNVPVGRVPAHTAEPNGDGGVIHLQAALRHGFFEVPHGEAVAQVRTTQYDHTVLEVTTFKHCRPGGRHDSPHQTSTPSVCDRTRSCTQARRTTPGADGLQFRSGFETAIVRGPILYAWLRTLAGPRATQHFRGLEVSIAPGWFEIGPAELRCDVQRGDVQPARRSVAPFEEIRGNEG